MTAAECVPARNADIIRNDTRRFSLLANALLEFGWERAAILAAGYVVINSVTENAVKPRFMREGLDLSLLSLFVSLLFWGFVLGAVATIMAVPLTMVLWHYLAGTPGPSAPAPAS